MNWEASNLQFQEKYFFKAVKPKNESFDLNDADW